MLIQDWIALAQAAPYHLAVHASACSKTKWIASLSCGLTIFDDDARINNLSCWQRLKRFLKDHNLSISQLRMHYKDKMVDTASKAHGYFFSRRVKAALNIPYPEVEDWGVGFILNNTAYIQWVSDFGISKEIRPLNEKQLMSDAIILN